MQPSQTAIQRELEALRDIRRRSTTQGGPGALLLDPDLPAEQPTTTPPLSPQAWASVEQGSTGKDTDDASTSSSSGEGSNQLADDPFHLFWVPAHLHPELAPKEFKMFLKEHARGPLDGSASATLSRSSSVSSTASSSALGRKRSMLSRQYKPRESDSVEEEEHIVPIRRNRSIYAQDGPKLTISDLQKLEELADEASKSDDPSKLRRVIRRSMSLNVAPSFLDSMDDVPDVGDDADAPIIVPRPNQILRRAARTKIRKPGLAGDGGGHRFPATRRKSGRAATIDAHITQERSSGEISDFEPHRRPPLPKQKADEDGDEPGDYRRNTFTDIYEAYTHEPDEGEPHLSTSPPLLGVDRPASPPPPVPSIPPIALPSQPDLQQPQPQRLLSPVLQSQQASEPSRSPSPESPAAATPAPAEEIRRIDPRTTDTSTLLSTSPVSGEKRKEKDSKKSLLKKWGGGGDKNSKKNGKEKEREKEKDSGFFGSLFGKKKQEEPSSTLGNGSGPATAAALLGASKTSKGYQPSISPQLGNPYARYPIHVERAVYRLSHIKLANPRRPLYEQVLISNLMFWYLGVINKAQQGPGANGSANTANQGQLQAQQASSNAQGSSNGEAAQDGTPEQGQQQEREGESSDWERQQEQQERERSPEPKRRGSLTKTPQPGSSAAAGRRAEMPVKGPQYGLQHQVIEQEYGPGPPTVGGSLGRTASAPPQGGTQSGYSNRGGAPRANPQSARQQMASKDMYTQPDGNSRFSYGRSSGESHEGDARSPSPGRSGPQSQSQNLPPGAMSASMPGEQTWYGSTSRTSPSKPHRPNEYPSKDWMGDWTVATGVGSVEGGAKLPARSLSANAVTPANNAPPTNLRKKVASATAVDSSRRPMSSDGNEEEDVPLAVWQQRRR